MTIPSPETPTHRRQATSDRATASLSAKGNKRGAGRQTVSNNILLASAACGAVADPRPCDEYHGADDDGPLDVMLAHCPARPLDARWHIVCRLTRRGASRPGRRHDEWVRKAFRYMRGLLNCRSAADRERLARRMPDVGAAYTLHIQPDKLTRGALEARLLARQSVEETAAACGLVPEVVQAYTALFFDVHGKLDASAFIMINAVGPKIWDGTLTEDDPDLLLKLFAYLKGPHYLETVLRYFHGWPGWSPPERLEQLSLDELGDAADMLGMRALVLAKVLPFQDLHRALRVMELAQELQRYIDGRRAAESRAAGDTLLGTASPFTAAAGSEASANSTREGAAEQTDPGVWYTAWKAAVLAA